MTGTALFRATACAALALGLSACGGSSDTSSTVSPVAATSTETIGLAMPTRTNQRWIADGTNMVKQFQVLGYKTDLQFADDSIQNQVSQVDQMIARHDSALVIGAIDGPALKAVLQKAADAKIPILSYDRLILGSPNINYYATFDNYKVGVLQASYLIKQLGLSSGHGPYNIELFAGSPDDNNAKFFFNGAMSLLKPYIHAGKLVVRSGDTTFAQAATQGWVAKTAQTRMAKLLSSSDRSVHVDAVLSPNDGLARGIVAALQADGYGSGSKKLPLVTGQDAELDSVKAVKAGTQGETVYKDTRELAKVAVQMTDSMLTGGQPAVNDTKQYNNGVKTIPTFLLQPVSVTRSNLQSVLVDSGYYTAAEVG